jgi:hypothetical protein
VANITAVGLGDVFVHKMDASGNFAWVATFGGSGANYGRSIAFDPFGNLLTTGYFGGTTDFDPGSGTANLTAFGLFDIFVQKMTQTPTGILELENGIRVNAYPNPSNGFFQILFDEPMHNTNITLRDAQGKTMFTKNLINVKDERIYVDGPAGMYFLTIETPGGQAVVKLIKE